MRIVLDTNVLVSGLMNPRGTPGRILEAWRNAQFEVLMSRDQLTELARVLSYPKIRQRLQWNQATTNRFLKQIYLRTESLDLEGVEAVVPRDPADGPILGSLIVAKADFLVTGDDDLLSLREGYPIVTPTEFAQRL